MQGAVLIDSLLDRGLISVDQSIVVKTESSQNGTDIETVLLNNGFIDETTVADLKTEATGMQICRFENRLIDPVALSMISVDTAIRYRVFPIYFDSERSILEVAVSSPNDILARDALNSLLYGKCSIEYRLARSADITRAIESSYELELSIDGIVSELGKTDTLASSTATNPNSDILADGVQHPVVRLVDAVIVEAYKSRCSDIHFEPEPGFFRIRHRIDGVLQTARTIHVSHWPATATRLKVMAGLNIAETRDAQDGAFTLSIGGTALDIRMSVFPTIHGENVVLRLLDPATVKLDLAAIGFDAHTRKNLARALKHPQGMTLLVGPTGCGKTTTLYALLNQVADETVNVMTLEDPVEYQLPMIRQCSVNQGSKLDFASGIRSILRQDPDIILVGEIRDRETAELSFRAAMTGHHVLATLHTSSALGVYQRLIELGVDAPVVYESVNTIVSQRLLRQLCPLCKTLTDSDLGQPSHYLPTGCNECGQTGYRGRTAVAETVLVTPELRGWLDEVGSGFELDQRMKTIGHRSLYGAGRALVNAGLTSFNELQRVIGAPDGDVL